jgi:hypothetical protein
MMAPRQVDRLRHNFVARADHPGEGPKSWACGSSTLAALVRSTAAAVAQRQRVTTRYVHKLFEGEGRTFSALVLDRRAAATGPLPPRSGERPNGATCLTHLGSNGHPRDGGWPHSPNRADPDRRRRARLIAARNSQDFAFCRRATAMACSWPSRPRSPSRRRRARPRPCAQRPPRRTVSRRFFLLYQKGRDSRIFQAQYH